MAQGLTAEQQQVMTDFIETGRMSIGQAGYEAIENMRKAITELANRETSE